MHPKMRLLPAASQTKRKRTIAREVLNVGGELQLSGPHIGTRCAAQSLTNATEVRCSLRKIANYCKCTKALVPKVSTGSPRWWMNQS